MARGSHDEKFLRISSEIQRIWNYLTSIREIIEHCVSPSKSRCDVIGKNSLWVRLLANQLVMVRTLSGGGPGGFEEIGDLLKGS